MYMRHVKVQPPLELRWTAVRLLRQKESTAVRMFSTSRIGCLGHTPGAVNVYLGNASNTLNAVPSVVLADSLRFTLTIRATKRVHTIGNIASDSVSMSQGTMGKILYYYGIPLLVFMQVEAFAGGGRFTSHRAGCSPSLAHILELGGG